MITPWEVYWITRLDSVHGFFIGLFAVSFVMMGMCGSFIMMEQLWNDEDIWPSIKKKYTIGIIIPLVAIFLATLTPSTKEACVIYLIPKIANNEQVQKIPNNFAKLLNTKMEEWINDSIIEQNKVNR